MAGRSRSASQSDRRGEAGAPRNRVHVHLHRGTRDNRPGDICELHAHLARV